MQKVKELMQNKAAELLQNGTVAKVMAWQAGEFFYDNNPAAFTTAEECADIVYNEFCPANLCKYLIEATRKGEKTAVFLKPCDTYGVNQLLKDNRVKREFVYAVGTPCSGMLDHKKIIEAGCKGVTEVKALGDKVFVTAVNGNREFAKADLILDKCTICKGNQYMIADEEIGEKLATPEVNFDRFAAVKRIEAMKPAERFAFWQGELSKCIRCNSCRDVCPACSCEQCIFDHPAAYMGGKAAADEVEESLFHIIRAFHVAGRCVGCGECSRVCPQGVSMGLLNNKLIKDINEFYGAYQAGTDATTKSTLISFQEDDVETTIVEERR